MTSTAGIVTALATIITAIATISGVLYHGKGKAQRPTPAFTTATAGDRSATSFPQPISANARIQWGPGNLLITNGGTSLTNVPPGNYQNVVGDIYGGDSSIAPFAGTTLALWTSNKRPTAQQCQYLTTTQADPGQSVQVVPGSVVCAVISGGIIAIMRVISVNSADSTIETRTIVWDLPGN